jgi:hypothetical protein
MIEDRHADPEVEVFVERDDAIRRARALVEENNHYPQDIEVVDLNNAMINAGWVWYCRYSNEGDCVTVMARQLQ